jgi:hypothetical protein
VEGKKVTDQQIVAKLLMSILLLLQKMLKDKVKNNLINDDNDDMGSHTHFMEQAFNKPYSSMECKCTTKEIERIRNPSKRKTHTGTTRYPQRS